MRVLVKLPGGNPAVVEVSKTFMVDSNTLGFVEMANSSYYVVDVDYNSKLHETLNSLLKDGYVDLSSYIAEKRM